MSFSVSPSTRCRQSFSLTTRACLMIGFLALGSLSTPAFAVRPALVDHSTTKYFPPIDAQYYGSCTCWSSCYYYATYEHARARDLDASTGDPDVICSHRFMFAVIAQNTYGAECTEHAMTRLTEIGCAPASQHPLDTYYNQWPSEEGWVAALNNRMGTPHAVRADNEAGLETIKQHIADGGCAVTRAYLDVNYYYYPDATGIDNDVLYAPSGGNWMRHSLCICGYDDNKTYWDHRDYQYHQGAFLIANSLGPDWGAYNSTGTGTKGFFWVAYSMFLESEFGFYDNDSASSTDYCYDNPEYPTIYYNDVRAQSPTLYAVVGINCSDRNALSLTGGIGSPNSPSFTGPFALMATPHGNLPIYDTKPVAVDLSDGIGVFAENSIKNVFISLSNDITNSDPADITSLTFYSDFDGDGVYSAHPKTIDNPIPVAPLATVNLGMLISSTGDEITIGDVNCDGAIDVFDIDPFVAALVDVDDYATTYPNCSYLLADINGDDIVDVFDIDPFVQCIIHGKCNGDWEPPTPNPPRFNLAGYPLATDSIIYMIAEQGQDNSGDPIEYYFEEITGNPGRTSSGWKTDTFYVDQDVVPGVTYGYRVKMRDSFGNETEWSNVYYTTVSSEHVR